MSTARADIAIGRAHRCGSRRLRRLFPALWLCLLITPLAQAGEPLLPIEVPGGDFPVLVQPTHLPPPLDDAGLPTEPGCEAVRASRVDELPFPWRDAVERIHLDCDPQDSANDILAFSVIAFLRPGRVTLAGYPVIEIRLRDSAMWGDHQYVIGAPYAKVATDVRRRIENICRQRQLLEEHPNDAACRMQEADEVLYLEPNELSSLWIHADPDDGRLTIYAETWAD